MLRRVAIRQRYCATLKSATLPSFETRQRQRSVVEPPRTPTASTITSEFASEYSELATRTVSTLPPYCELTAAMQALSPALAA
jgi:hypothetical protein